MVNYQLAKRRAGTHKTKTIAEIAGSTARPWRQKGTGRARQGFQAATQMREGGTSSVRSRATIPIRCRRRSAKLALATALSRRSRPEGKLIILDEAEADRLEDQDAGRASGGAGLEFGTDHRRGGTRPELHPRGGEHSEHRRAAPAGRQRLRHPAARRPGPDQGCRQAPGGAPEMKCPRSDLKRPWWTPEACDVIRRRSSPKSRRWFGTQPGGFRVAARCQQARKFGCQWRPCSR